MKWICGTLLAAVSIAAASPAVAQQWSGVFESREAGFYGIGSVFPYESGISSVWIVDAPREINNTMSYTVRNIYIDCLNGDYINQRAVAYNTSDEAVATETSEYLGRAMLGYAPREPIDPDSVMGIYFRIVCEGERRPPGSRHAQPGQLVATYRAWLQRQN